MVWLLGVVNIGDNDYIGHYGDQLFTITVQQNEKFPFYNIIKKFQNKIL